MKKHVFQRKDDSAWTTVLVGFTAHNVCAGGYSFAAFRERIRKRLRPRLRERIRQRFWKRSRQGQRQRKRKGPQITLARVTSLPTAMASHPRSWQRLRHIGAPACPGYRYHQPTPTTHSPLAAPPFRCTCLAPLPPLLDSIFKEPIWRLHHIGAPAMQLTNEYNVPQYIPARFQTNRIGPDSSC